MSESSLKMSFKFFLPLIISTMIFNTSFMDPINWPKNIALLTVLPILLAYSSLGLNLRSLSVLWFPFSLISLAILGLIGTALFTNTQGVITLWGSFGRNNGLITTLSFYIYSLACIFITFRKIESRDILLVFSLGFIPATIYGAMQSVGIDPITWSKTNEVFSFFGNSNFAGAIFAISAVCSLLILVFYRKENNRTLNLVIFFSFVLSLYTSYSTKSLQGIMGILIAVSLIAVIVLMQNSRSVAYIYTIALMSFGTLVVAGFLGRGLLGDRIEQYTLILRTKYWFAGIKMGLEHLPWGVGFDNFGAYFQEFRPDEAILITGVNLTTNNAHNPFIQAFATTGVLGAIPFLVLFFYAIFLAVRNLISKEPTLKKQVISIVFLSTWAMAFFSIDNIAVAVINWSFMGLVIGFTKEKAFAAIQEKQAIKVKKTRKIDSFVSWRKTISWIIGIAIFVFSWVAAWPNRELGKILQNPPQNQTVLRQSIDSLIELSNSPFTREVEYKWISDGLVSYASKEDAIRVLQHSIDRFPRDMTLLDNLAYQYESSGNFNDAIRVREQQLIIETRNWRVYYFLGLDLIRIEQFEKLDSIMKKIDSLTLFMNSEEKSEWTKTKADWIQFVE